jgi:hypothetical protein
MDWQEIISAKPALVHFESGAIHAHDNGIDWFDYLAQHEVDLRRLLGSYVRRPECRCPSVYEAVVRHLARVWATGKTTAVKRQSPAEEVLVRGQALANSGKQQSHSMFAVRRDPDGHPARGPNRDPPNGTHKNIPLQTRVR